MLLYNLRHPLNEILPSVKNMLRFYQMNALCVEKLI